MREGQLAEQLLQHCWRANISVGKAVRRVFIAPNTQCSVGCPALTQRSAWAGFDLSGMSPLGGGGTTPGIFQVHGVDSTGHVVIRRQLKRRAVLAFFQKLLPCLVGIEACASSHHWSRELQALGHTVRLMPPAYVKPYVKRQKNDMADAEAICEAVTAATMRFVPTKTPEQQSCLMLHRTRIHPPADGCDQFDPSSPRRVRHCRPGRAQRGHGTAACCCRPER